MKLKEIFTAAELQETGLQRGLASGSPDETDKNVCFSRINTNNQGDICIYFYFLTVFKLIKIQYSQHLVHVNV